MKLDVKLHGFGSPSRSVMLDAGATYLDMLRQLGISRETVVVFANDEPVPPEDTVDPDASLRILKIVSGGQDGGFGGLSAEAPRKVVAEREGEVPPRRRLGN